jgi:lambda family phage portal protein
MSLFSKLFGPRERRPVVARYDAAQTSGLNHRHWGQADALNADSALAPLVRRTLRNRARYEAANNSYLAGMLSTLATDLVGSGPRLRLDAGPDADPAAVRAVELAVQNWALAIDLAGKLRTLRHARAVDGEVFAVTITNRRLAGVQLDIRLLEAEHIADPTASIDPQLVDGIRHDDDGNPAAYYVLRHHPGASTTTWTLAGDWINADEVFHWYHANRPGQHRGVPEITPALELFAMLRRYTLAVVTAAETAASFAAILHTNTPGAGRDAAEVEAWEPMPIARGMVMAAPEGWAPSQLKPEQPTATFDQFTRTLLNEIARCLNLPFNVAALNSSSYNYSSGRMDYQVYHKHLRTLRADLERAILDPLFGKWLDEAALVPGLLPDGLPPVATWEWNWTWDGAPDVDPVKEAEADALRLESHTTTLADVCARAGKDWRAVLRQRAAELEAARELGLAPAPLPAAATPPPAAAARGQAVTAQSSRTRTVVVHGPPASGKSTYVAEHKGPRDLVFDFDRIMQALSGNDPHRQTEELVEYCLAIRELVLDKIRRGSRVEGAWIITTRLRPEFVDSVRPLEPEFVHMDTPMAECLRRVDADPNRAAVAPTMKRVIRDYFAEQSNEKATTTAIDPEPIDLYDLARPISDDPMPDPDALEAAEPLELAESYKAPNAARDEAIRGLAWREEYGRGGTAVGVARARDLANGRPLSETTLRRMVSFFARHAGNRQAPGWRPGEAGYPSASRIAHALWGGDAGRDWANRLVQRLDREEATA